MNAIAEFNDVAATILIIDDEGKNRKLLEALLQPEGYVTLSAASGDEGLESIAKHAPDLILLDVMMPGMDGYAVASALKASPDTANIPIIMVTARSERSARLAGLTAGAEEFLTKPVDRVELSLRVRNLLRLKAIADLQNHSRLLEQEVLARTTELRRSTELQLVEAAKQMAILDALPAHIALLDGDGLITAVNEAWRQFSRGNALDLPGDGVGVSYLGTCINSREKDCTGAGRATDGVRSVLNGDADQFSLEYPCHSPMTERWFLMTVTPLSNDRPSGAIVMHTNITARKQAEEEVQRLNLHLEERVRLRTAQLVAANQELEAFSYSASHDLRTPLSAIDGYSSLLGKEISAGEVSESTKHYLSRIRVNVAHMGDMIDALLSLAQVSRSRLCSDH
uniref:response regulator n=1 Tax=Polaromonas sp. TaxID=1869339 RepID=UPI0037513C3C